MSKVVLFITLSLLPIAYIFSQEFGTKESLGDSCHRKLFVRFESTSFIKNNEYSNSFTKGFTGIGFFLKPTVEYYLTESTKVSVGTFFLKYSGIDHFREVVPIFSVQQKLTKSLDLIFGSIYGTLNHQIEEPFFRFDTYYQNNVEYGIQLLYNTSLVNWDVWLNWEKFIFKDDPFQEEIQAGVVANFKVLSVGKFESYVPLQMLIYHKGGEIDTSPDPILTLFNAMSGLRLKYKISDTHNFAFEPLLFLYRAPAAPSTGVNAQQFKKGRGVYLNFKYQNSFFNASLGYWSAERFIAPLGEYLFMSISEFDNSFSQASRDVITAKVGINHNISESVKLIFRTDGYFDLINKNFAYSYGLYFLINESFFVHKLKRYAHEK